MGTNMEVEVVWAFSRSVICNLSLSSKITIRELKKTISERTRVPVRFLDVMCEDKVATDTHRLHDFGDAELQMQVLRKQPTELLSMLREWYIRDWNTSRGTYPEHSAVARCDLPILECIIATDADASLVNEKHEVWPRLENQKAERAGSAVHQNCTVLHYAVLLRDAQLCKLILDHPGFQGANVCGTIKYNFLNWTALHIACDLGVKDVCLLLLRHPQFTAVWDRDFEGRTALHHAMYARQHEVVAALLDQHHDLKSHHYALDLAVESYDDCQRNYRPPSPDMQNMLVQRCAKSMSHLSPEANAFLRQPENRNMLQDSLKHCGRLLAGVHLGKGHLDLEQAVLNRFDQSTKDELAHHRYVKLQRRRRFAAKASEDNRKRMWRSKASRITSKHAVFTGYLED
ncbi:unnamed protein product [Effrenium voratum]|nr:unnamed protein product [Effrenium voratum]